MKRPEQPVPTVEQQVEFALADVRRVRAIGVERKIPLTIKVAVNTELYEHLIAKPVAELEGVTIEHEPRLLPGRVLFHAETPVKKPE
jgi:hypothetical protein